MSESTRVSVRIGRGNSIHSGTAKEGYGVIGTACGSDVGFRSGGSRIIDAEVTCKRCLKALAAK